MGTEKPSVSRRNLSRWLLIGALEAFALENFFGGGTAASGQPPGHPQFQVNSYTTSAQQEPRVSAVGLGISVVVWASRGSLGSDTSEFSVQGRVFDLTGRPLTGDFQVNSYTPLSQFRPDVAVDASGGFVVVWEGYGWGPDTSYLSINGRRFAADGTPIGDEFQVNSFTDLSQQRPRVQATPDGGFLVVWESEASLGTDTDGKSVLARRFAVDGTPLGPDFQVNAYTTSWQHRPAVAVAGDGRFVVVWTGPSAGTDTSYSSVQARRFDANGLPLGEDFQVNTYTPWVQFHPAVAMFEGGEFVVAWSSDGSDGTDQSYSSIQVRRFDAQGNPLGSDFQVNTSTLDYQDFPSVAPDDLGTFVVAWESRDPTGPDPDDRVDARRIHFQTGVAEPEFLVNEFTSGGQDSAAVATATGGDFVVVWSGIGPANLDSDRSVQGRAFDGLFRDGFEGGDASRWSQIAPTPTPARARSPARLRGAWN